MKEPTAVVGSPPVPAFLMKLWTLVEDPSNSDVIAWNWDGQNFCILDEQRFSKEILPKYFKHNNLSSFIRQLNMYGFRKMMSLESGLVKSDRGSTIEFQHPFFKKGKAELLEKIKRKISSVKSEDHHHLSEEELQKVVSELQNLKYGQNNMDKKLENMRRENQALWKEVAMLRRRHSQQQKLLTKVLQFILSLMRGNIVMGPKRKRQLTLEATQSPPPKYSRHSLQLTEDGEQEMAVPSQIPENSAENILESHQLFSPGEGTSKPTTNAVEQIQNFTVHPAISEDTEVPGDTVQEIIIDDSVLQLQSLADQTLIPSSSKDGEELALELVPANSFENPDSVFNSILSENSAVNSNDLLDREDIHDFLSCIDASLEELQNMLSIKKLNVDSDFIDELFKPDLSSSDNAAEEPNTSIVNELQELEEDIAVSGNDAHLNKDKQLMQYTGGNFLSLFEHPSNNSEKVPADPTTILTTLEDGLYPDSSAGQGSTVLGHNFNKESDLLVEDFSGPQELIPIFVLSPVNKLIDEVTEAETL